MNRKNIIRLRGRLVLVTIVLILLTATSMSLVFILLKRQQKAHNYSQSILTTMTFAVELRKSSDNLSRFAFAYLSSQDTFYKKCYFEELSIRKGEIPRPANYAGGHWETTLLTDSSDTHYKDQPIASYEERLIASGIPKKYRNILSEIEDLSDSLAVYEKDLFEKTDNQSLSSQNAIQLFLNPTNKINHLKSEIVKKLDQFYHSEIQLYDNELEKSNDTIRQLTTILAILILFSIVTFVLILTMVFRISQYKLKGLEKEITERKKIQTKLEKNHLQLTNAQRVANFASWEYNSEQKVIVWSNQIYELLEIETKDGIPPKLTWDNPLLSHPSSTKKSNTLNFLDFIHPEDRSAVLQIANNQQKDINSHQAHYRLKLKNGKVKYISSVTEVKKDATSIIITGVLKDITNEKISEIKLKNSHKELLKANIQLQAKEKELNKANSELNRHKNHLEELVEQRTKELTYSKDILNALFKELPLGIALFDATGQATEMNPLASKIFQLPEDEIIQRETAAWNIIDKNHKPLALEDFPVMRVLKDKKPILNEDIGIINNDGTLLWFSCNFATLSDEFGGGAILVYTDISEKKKIEQDIIHAKEQAEKAYKSKSRFLSNMSHEIRTPLHAIIGFAELLDAKIEDKQLKHYASTIQSAGKNLSSLINDILDLAKIEAGKISLTNELIDLHQFKKELKSLFTLKASEKDLMLEIKLTSSVPRYVLIDELRLRQILFNLISNAIKFTAKGHVTVTINAKDITEDTISLHLTVKDSGKGINQDKLNEIFDDFSQESEEVSKNFGGTGLGLSITRRLVNLFNGEISVKSNIGIGSTFEIVLPEIEISPNTLTLTSLSSSKTVDLSKVCILVVDDNNDNRNLMVEHLRDLNAKILVAKNGLEATEQAESQKPHLILMDIKMPVMDGYQAAKLIINNETTAHIPIIACTASAFSQVENHILQVGFKGYLRKPVLKKDLIEELSKHLTHTPLSDEEKIIPKKNIQERFKQEIMPAWENFKATKIKNSKINLAKKIVEIAKRLDNKHLEKIGTDLTEAIYEFDVAKTNMLINKIEALINND
ncbi:ATP-binding protein [Sunxiuqinia elliptica]